MANRHGLIAGATGTGKNSRRERASKIAVATPLRDVLLTAHRAVATKKNRRMHFAHPAI
jgi:hypothetical protein